VETPTGAQLDKVVRSIWENFSGRRLELTPAREFCAAWCTRVSKNRAEKTGVRYMKVTEDFLAHLGARADYDIKSITVADVQGFMDRRGADGKRGTTLGIEAKILRALFNSAMRAGAIEKNPAGMLDLPDAVQEEREPFTPAEVEMLVAATAGTEWQTAILLAAYAGMRLGDAVTLRWDAIDLAGRMIAFIPQKTSRKKRVLRVPMVPRLADHLEDLAGVEAAQKEECVMPGLAGRMIGGRSGLSQEFKGIMKRADIDAGAIANSNKAHRKLTRKSFHSLRHSHASMLVNSGASTDIRRQTLGHADEEMTRRYSHLEDKTVRKAMLKMPGAKGKKQ